MSGAITKAKAGSTRQENNITDIENVSITGNGDYIVTLDMPCEKISFQQAGSLVGTVTFSLTGIDFVGSTAIPAASAIGTYSSSMAKVVKITVTSGTGRIVISGK